MSSLKDQRQLMQAIWRKRREYYQRFQPEDAHDFEATASLNPKPLGEVAGLQLFSVDGDYVKDRLDPDFVEGGNYMRYAYIPQGQVWIDRNVEQHDWPPILLHELTETKQMEKGRSYDEAHKQANEYEHQYREQLGIGGCRCDRCRGKATAEKFAREFYARGWRPEHYRQSAPEKESEKEPAGGWVTLGGARAHVNSSGVLDAACAGLKGESLDDIGEDESEEHRAVRDHRQDVAEHHGVTGDQLTRPQVKALETHPHPKTGQPARRPEPAKPTQEPAQPIHVKIGNQDYEVSQQHGMWFFRRTPEAGWTLASRATVEEIEKQTKEKAAVKPPSEPGERRASAVVQEAVAKGRQKTASREARRSARTDRMQAITQTAEDYGVSPDELMDAIRYVLEEKQNAVRDREAAKASARKLTGLSQRDTARLSQNHDFASAAKIGGPTGDKLARFDVWGEEIARQHPELGWGTPEAPRVDFSAALWDLINEGVQKPPSASDPEILREAAQYAVANRGESGGAWGHEEGEAPAAQEEVPEWLANFRRSGKVEKYRAWLGERRRVRELFQKEWYAKRKPAAGQRGMFDEAEHPRDEAGEFTRKGGGGATGIKEPPRKPDMAEGQRDLFTGENLKPKAAEEPKAKEPPKEDVKGKQTAFWHGLKQAAGTRNLFDLDLLSGKLGAKAEEEKGPVDKISILSNDPESGGIPVYRGTRPNSRGSTYTFWTPERDYAEGYMNEGGDLEAAYLTDTREILDMTAMIRDGYISGSEIDSAVPGLAEALGIDAETEIESDRLWDAAGEDLTAASHLLREAGYRGFRWVENNNNEAYLLLHDEERNPS
jgi:hypothetical protein